MNAPVSPEHVSGPRVGYILKMFPRLSETFILNEILGLERRGVDVSVFSLLLPNDGRFQGRLQDLKLTVCYMPRDKPEAHWEELKAELGELAPSLERWQVAADWLNRWKIPKDLDLLLRAARIAAEVKRRGITHLHAHFATIATRVAGLVHLLTGVPFSFTSHAKDIFRQTVNRDLYSDLLTRSAFNVTVSDHNRAFLLERTPGADPNKIRRLYNGIDLEFFHPPSGRDERLDELRILSVGRLVPKKGFPDLLQALATLKRRGITYTARIVGDGELRADLDRLVEELDLSDSVALTGSLTAEAIQGECQRASMMVLACCRDADGNQDALPTVLLEALAVDLPIVSTRIGGVPEIVGADAGVVVEPGQPEALADAIESLHDRIRSGGWEPGQSRARAQRLFDLHHNVGQLARMFEESGVQQRRSFAYVSADPGIPLPGVKGASIHVESVCREMVRSGLTGTVYGARTGAERVADCRLLQLDSKVRGGDELTRVMAGFQVIESRCSPQFVYERYSLWGLGGLRMAQTLGVPFVLEVNSPLPEEASQHRDLQLGELATTVARRLLTEAGLVICVSNQVAEWAKTVSGREGRIEVVPNGVDTELFSPGQGLRREPLPQQPAPVIAFCGSFRPWHGLDLLLESFLAVREQIGNAHLLCLGDGPGRAGFAEAVEAAGVRSHVHLTGAIPHAEVPTWLSSADVAVVPYAEAGDFYFSPLKLFEAMSLGLPVVASDRGQVSEVLQGGRTGWLCQPGSSRQLADSILEVLQDRPRSRRTGEAARAWVLENASWDLRVKQILEKIEALL